VRLASLANPARDVGHSKQNDWNSDGRHRVLTARWNANEQGFPLAPMQLGIEPDAAISGSIGGGDQDRAIWVGPG
jgi:hypothetical protein